MTDEADTAAERGAPWWASSTDPAPEPERSPWDEYLDQDRDAETAGGRDRYGRPRDVWEVPNAGGETIPPSFDDRRDEGGDLFGDVAEVMARLAKEALRRTAQSRAGQSRAGQSRAATANGAGNPTGATTEQPPVVIDACAVCPIGATMRVVGDSRPEVVEHLVEASRHLTLAFKAMVDAQLQAYEADAGFERITVDDDEWEAPAADGGDWDLPTS